MAERSRAIGFGGVGAAATPAFVALAVQEKGR